MSSKKVINKSMVNDFISISNASASVLGNESIRIRQIEGDLNIHELDVNRLKAAPAEWNFYRPLGDNKMEQLIMSIMENGLLNPLIVWEGTGAESYTVLSGHNRLEAYRRIYEQTADSKYLKIPAFIKGRDEISPEQAQEIIIDTNWVQRELSPMEKAKSILKKYAIIESDASERRRRKRDIVCQDYGLKGRQVENYYKLNGLIKDFKDMIDENLLTIKSGIKLALFDEATQSWMLENYIDRLDYKRTGALKSGMNREQIRAVLEGEESEYVMMRIPKELQGKIAEIIKNHAGN